MIQHYRNDSCTPEWLTGMLVIEREANIDGEYDHEYASGLVPRNGEHCIEDGKPITGDPQTT